MRQAVLLAIAIPALALAQGLQKVPARFGYQGRLLDQSGAALNGTHQVTFSIYKQPTGGGALWSETQKLALTSGFYATFLGAVTPLPVDFDSAVFPAGTKVFDGSDLYLGVAVDGTEELTPRQQIGAVVYALRTAWAVRAKDADHADEATHAASATSALSATDSTKAVYATNAGHADTAGRADSGYADSAGTATYVSGQGTVNTSAVTTGSLTVIGAASVTGLVLGGGTASRSTLSTSWSCAQWGTGSCSSSSGPGCSGGGSLRTTGFLSSPSAFGSTTTSYWICVQ